MGRRQDNSPSEISDERLEWLEEELGQLESLAEDAWNCERPNYQAVAALKRQCLVVRNEMDNEKIRRAELALAEEPDAPSWGDMNDEERAEYLRTWAAAVPDEWVDDLEVVVRVWLERTGRSIEARDGLHVITASAGGV